MSALFGALSTRGAPLPPGLGAQMAHALAHRPAEVLGLHQQDVLLLGARSHWLAAEDEGQSPPWVDPTSGVFVLFDGRLDHRERLSSELGDPRGRSDAALVASAHARWGEDFVSRLRGDFALGLWDPRERTLILARDAFGVRPLYWAYTASGVLLFASQARPLFAHPELSRELDALRVGQYLAGVFADAERTFFRGIARLAPGHRLRVREGDAAPRTQRYFAFDPRRELAPRSNAEFAEQFRELFLGAVRVRTRTSAPLGCLLSGGVDSSGLLGALRALDPTREIPCFSARFVDFPEIDEGHWLELLDAPGVVRAELRADRIDPLGDLDALHAALDEPFHAPNLFIYYSLARLARAHGTRVLLDGLDGDTVVDHGYGALRELLLHGRPRRFARALRALHRSMGFSYHEMLRDFVFQPERQALFETLARFRLAPCGYASAEFARASGLLEDLARRAPDAFAPRTTLRALHHRALTHPILPFYLEVYDKVAALLGVEHRHPYFDLELMEFCLALPSQQRLFEGWDRVIQRRAFTGLVPEPIRARQGKSVWTRNFERQLFQGQRARIRDLLVSSASPLAGYCDLDRLRRDLPALEAGRLPERVMDLWSALTLGAWLQVGPARLPEAASV